MLDDSVRKWALMLALRTDLGHVMTGVHDTGYVKMPVCEHCRIDGDCHDHACIARVALESRQQTLTAVLAELRAIARTHAIMLQNTPALAEAIARVEKLRGGT